MARAKLEGEALLRKKGGVGLLTFDWRFLMEEQGAWEFDLPNPTEALFPFNPTQLEGRERAKLVAVAVAWGRLLVG